MPWCTAGSGVLSPRQLGQVRRDAEVLELYRRGLSFDQIAACTGYANRSGPQKAVARILARCAHRDRAGLVHLEYGRLEALHMVLWRELFETGPTLCREGRLINRILHIARLEGELTGNFAELPPVGRRRPARTVGVWTNGLQLRFAGATFDEIAAVLGLSHRSVARRRLEIELADYVEGPVDGYRREHAERLDELQYAIWDDATASPAKLTAVDAVLSIITGRIRLLGLAPSPPPKPKGRRGRRPPPAPGPQSAIVVHPNMDTAERAQVDALITQYRSMQPGRVSPPACVTDERSHQ